jgi:hypothetical protein
MATPQQRLNALLAELDLSRTNTDTDPDGYWSARDAVFKLVDEFPELRAEARAYGLPV